MKGIEMASYTIKMAHTKESQTISEIIKEMEMIKTRFLDAPKMEKIEVTPEEFKSLCDQFKLVQKDPSGEPVSSLHLLGLPVFIKSKQNHNL